MIKNFCLVLDDVNKLKLALKGKSKQFFTGTTEYRMNTLNSLLDQTSAKEVNKLFEKAIASKKANALVKVFEQLTPKEEKKSSEYDGLIKKVVDLSKEGSFDMEGALDDYVEMKLGAKITAEEASTIKDLVTKMDESLNKGSDNKFDQYNIEYMKDRRKLQEYMEAITPASNLAVASSIIGRGNLLFAIKSGVTNIVGNMSFFVGEVITRRVQTGQFGIKGGAFIKDYMKHVLKVYNETGIDIIRVMEIEDTRSSLGEKVTTAQGKGIIRKAGRFYEDIVFKKALGLPDMAFASFHFADAVARHSYAMAKKEAKLMKQDKKWTEERAKNLMYASTQLNPEDGVAYSIREQAKMEALFGTMQNSNNMTTVLVFIRDGIDKVTGDAKLGSNIEPFVKTPTNVVRASSIYSGLWLPFSAVKYVKGIVYNKMSREELRETEANMIRSGLGFTFSLMIASLLWGDDKDEMDYIPDYASASADQKKIVMNGNATYNSVRVGDKWISLDYFGSFGTPLLAIVMAKKYGSDDLWGMTKETAFANWSQFTKLPIISTAFDTTSDVEKARKYNKTGAEIGEEYAKGLGEFLYNRSVPMIFSDIAKGMDDYQRRVDYASLAEKIQQNIPILREELPIKTNTFGEEMESEGMISQLLFGARIKSYNDDPTFLEVKRVMETGNNVTFDNMSDTVEIKELTNAIGGGNKFSPEMQDHYAEIGKLMKDNFKWVMKTKEYKEASNEEKAKILNDARSQAVYSYGVQLIREGVIDSVRERNFTKPKFNYPHNTLGISVKNL